MHKLFFLKKNEQYTINSGTLGLKQGKEFNFSFLSSIVLKFHNKNTFDKGENLDFS